MKMVNKWVGLYGTYDVPDAIVWLATKANERVGLSFGFIDYATGWKEWSQSPGFKVAAEWGAWRDAQEASQ